MHKIILAKEIGFSEHRPPVWVSRAVSLTQLQTIMTRDGRTTLEQCRQPVKNLNVLPAATVDMIFDNPKTPYKKIY